MFSSQPPKSNNLTVQKDLNNKEETRTTATVRSTIWRLTQWAHNNNERNNVKEKKLKRIVAVRSTIWRSQPNRYIIVETKKHAWLKQNHHWPLDLRSNGLDLEGLFGHTSLDLQLKNYLRRKTKPNRKQIVTSV